MSDHGMFEQVRELQREVGQWQQAWYQAYVRIAWLTEALDTMRGHTGTGPWIAIYRDAGGGYEGLQAIATVALEDGPEASDADKLRAGRHADAGLRVGRPS